MLPIALDDLDLATLEPCEVNEDELSVHICGTVLDFEGLEVDDMGLAGVEVPKVAMGKQHKRNGKRSEIMTIKSFGVSVVSAVFVVLAR